MSERKIVQIAVRAQRVYALANDGTLWVWNDGRWNPFSALPQPEKSALERAVAE